MRIGIDIDGVLYPWADVANEAVMAEFGVPDPGPHHHWTWLKEQITSDQWSWLWTPRGQQSVFGRLHRVYPGVVEAFDAILGSGHECHFVTHRDPACAGIETAEFLTRHFGRRRWAGLHVVKATPKHTLAEWDVFIDDKPETVLEMLIETRAKVFAPARPWNEELADESLPLLGTDRLVRYTDPAAVAEWVLARS